jgi:hypothetical protein
VRVGGRSGLISAHPLFLAADLRKNGLFNFRLNMQVGSSTWGYPDSRNTRTRFNFLVDYVRAYSPGS